MDDHEKHNPGEPEFGEGHGGAHNPGEQQFGGEDETTDPAEPGEGAQDADDASERAEGHS